MAELAALPEIVRPGGEKVFTDLIEHDDPYAAYVGRLSAGIATYVEGMGAARTDMDDVYKEAFNEVVTSLPQLSELGGVEMGTPETATELKTWTLGCVTRTLVNGWSLGQEFNVWAKQNLAADLPLYQLPPAA